MHKSRKLTKDDLNLKRQFNNCRLNAAEAGDKPGKMQSQDYMKRGIHMKITKHSGNKLISGIATQKEIENFLRNYYLIRPADFRKAVKEARLNNWIWTDIYAPFCDKIITVYTVQRKMYFAVCPSVMWTVNPTNAAQ